MPGIFSRFLRFLGGNDRRRRRARNLRRRLRGRRQNAAAPLPHPAVGVPLTAQRLPSPTVADFGDEPRVQLWEGEAYQNIFVSHENAPEERARVYPAFPPASPRTDFRRRFMTAMASSSTAPRSVIYSMTAGTSSSTNTGAVDERDHLPLSSATTSAPGRQASTSASCRQRQSPKESSTRRCPGSERAHQRSRARDCARWRFFLGRGCARRSRRRPPVSVAV